MCCGDDDDNDDDEDDDSVDENHVLGALTFQAFALPDVCGDGDDDDDDYDNDGDDENDVLEALTFQAFALPDVCGDGDDDHAAVKFEMSPLTELCEGTGVVTFCEGCVLSACLVIFPNIGVVRKILGMVSSFGGLFMPVVIVVESLCVSL
ncbi:hypothetical protein ElyMa_000102000 [Elysia marginata]|uniref:Uncharacterized protein n=1 Tax=Elysia marginata TaxID=1093978 RepID=A0AAV4EKB4_9GAST|nr:hypothetical protein ElyMa_000102000 [Elysia marginata]